MNLLEHLVLFLVSLVANTFSAFSGGGAGLIQFPLLIFLGLTFTMALATHKVASVALGLGAVIRYMASSHLERHFILIILLFGLPGVIIGSRMVLFIPENIAIFALGVLTGSLGFYSIFKPTLGQNYQPKRRDIRGLSLIHI